MIVCKIVSTVSWRVGWTWILYRVS